MAAIRKFMRLRSDERKLLVRAGITLATFRAALWLLPWSAVLRMLENEPADFEGFTVDRLAWAVRNASRVVPRSTCLTQALALQYLLSRAGRLSSIHIGVAKERNGGFKAHAWVEHNGETILGSSGEVAQYSRLLTVRAH
jgi:Transglutaminase-like superfamily